MKIVTMEVFFYCADSVDAQSLAARVAESVDFHNSATYARNSELPKSTDYRDLAYSGYSYSERKVKQA